MPTNTPSTAASPASSVTAAKALLLQDMRAYPSVSILLATTPGERLDHDSVQRLRRLREEAVRRLREEGLGNVRDLVLRLDERIAQAAEMQSDYGLALYASAAHDDLVLLPVHVHDRVVVDPTFATRDLVRSLHRTPRHVVLALSSSQAKLFDGQGRVLQPAQGSKFPLTHEPTVPRRMPGEVFLADVDRALGAYLRVHPAPLLIAGAEPTVSRFVRISRNVSRLAGVIRGNHLHTPLTLLASLAQPVLEDYLLSRQDEALDLLAQRIGQDRAVTGVDAVWLAARWERPEMLAVEQDFFYPARLSHDGDTLTAAADDIEDPDVLDDAVDEVIETVLARGGWIALVDTGRIPHGERIGLTLRAR